MRSPVPRITQIPIWKYFMCILADAQGIFLYGHPWGMSTATQKIWVPWNSILNLCRFLKTTILFFCSCGLYCGSYKIKFIFVCSARFLRVEHFTVFQIIYNFALNERNMCTKGMDQHDHSDNLNFPALFSVQGWSVSFYCEFKSVEVIGKRVNQMQIWFNLKIFQSTIVPRRL